MFSVFGVSYHVCVCVCVWAPFSISSPSADLLAPVSHRFIFHESEPGKQVNNAPSSNLAGVIRSSVPCPRVPIPFLFLSRLSIGFLFWVLGHHVFELRPERLDR